MTKSNKAITIIQPTTKYYTKQRGVPVTFNERRIRGKNLSAFVQSLRVGDSFVAPVGTGGELRKHLANSHGLSTKLKSTAIGKLKARYFVTSASA